MRLSNASLITIKDLTDEAYIKNITLRILPNLTLPIGV